MNTNIFQYVVLGIFAVLAAIGVIFFATMDPSKDSLMLSPITIWGPYDQNDFTVMVKKIDKARGGGLSKVSYVQKPSAELYSSLIESLASGGGPDLVIMEDVRLMAFLNKVYTVSFETYPQKLFKDSYVQGAEVFMLPDALYALPYTVDPMVLYWNRDIFNSAGLTLLPEYWDEFLEYVPKLTRIEGGVNLTQSAVSFGEYDNVLHAKEILSMLFMQAGTPIVSHNGHKFVSTLASETGTQSPAVAALRFYTDFSNPVKTVYTWNRSLPRSREAFMAGDLAMYFGFVSEEKEMRRTNPNLNFDIAVVPQRRGNSRLTYGRWSGLAVLKSSGNPGRAYQVAQYLTEPESLDALTEVTGLPPVRRDLLARRPSDSSRATAYDSAIIARSWLMPNETSVDEIFQNAVNGITSGKENTQSSVSLLHRTLSELLPTEEERGVTK